MNTTNCAAQAALEGILQNCKESDIRLDRKESLPDRYEIEHIVHLLRRVMFPGYFDEGAKCTLSDRDETDRLLCDAYHRLKAQTFLAFAQSGDGEAEGHATEACDGFFCRLPHVQSLLLKDVQAGFDGDPAAKSKEEIIYCYPGFYAISVYRMAHELYRLGVPLIPRIMTEESHNKTGIDINPGATIGEYFFIDHGTGVVIGETTVIGNRVKLYQGVTLGALSTAPGQALAGVRRHPTVMDGVTVYAGATILGGETVVGEGSVIGGNCFITSPIPPHTKVIAKQPELTLLPGKKK